MAMLVFGLILFLGIHSISIVALPLRDKLVAKSENGWKAFYTVVSVAGLYFIAQGYGAARLEPVLLYTSPSWFRHLAYLLMLPAMILLIAPYFPGKIKQITKHPQLIAVKLWAFSHLLVNGTLADVVLFGGFLAWAVADRISMKKRQERKVSGLNPSVKNDVMAVVIGLILAGIFVRYLHAKLIGMPLIG